MSNVQGMDALIHRLNAIGDTRAILHALQLSVVHEAQALVPRKTGHLFRTIQPGFLARTEASVVVTAPYGRWVEEGTGLYGPRKRRIVPTHAKALAWKTGGPSKLRLSGRSRVVGGKSLAGMAFARSTKGMQARPYLLPGAKRAVSKSGLANVVIKEWNGAA